MQDGLPVKQENLDVKINCSVIPEAVVVRAEITEGVSSLFRADVFLQTTKDVEAEKVIGAIATLSLCVGENQRHFSGIIEQMSFENIPSHLAEKTDSILYLKIVPTFAKTLYTRKYRAFQNQSAKEIIQKILKDDNIANSKLSLTKAGNNKRVFCVQYAESDFHFLSRLMEEEGIFYYFTQDAEKDTLQISDVSSSATKLKTELQIRKVATNATVTPDSAFNVSFSNCVGTKKVDAFSYNEAKAEVISGTASDDTDKTRMAAREFFDPLFTEKEIGNGITKTILEGENSLARKLTGSSYCPELSAGASFKLSGSEAKAHNGDFFAISVKHFINQLPENRDTPIYHNQFVAIPSDIAFRPARAHLKNRIYGCQTATVVGTSGEEIFCDEDARIKVRFHWDSQSAQDENSSCWIRVAQSWAGNKFGALVIPRVGMEVLIEFVNGDPDQPIVVGCLYNGVNKSPSDYAKSKNTVSTFCTNTSKGKGYNELRFDDKAESEEIFLHAQKDMNIIIENSASETLNEGSKSITLESKKDPTEHLLLIKKGANKVMLNDGDYTIVLDKGNQTITLKEGNQTIKLSKGDINIDVTGSISIKASKGINVEAVEAINVKSGKFTSIDAKDNINIKAAKDYVLECAKCSANAKMAMEFQAMSVKVDAKTSVELSGLSIKASAKTMLELSASAMTTVKAGAALQLQGSAGVSLSGAFIKLG